LLAVIYLIYNFFTSQTVYGRHLYAMGGNRKAAELSGIKAKELLFAVFVNMAFLSALSGIVFAGRLNAATPKAGGGWELDAIAACFIGGASTTGGVGTVGGAIIGGLIMGVLNNGMSIVGINVDWQQVIKGVVLLIAVLFDTYSKNRAKIS
jgi:putative multiple sugar transport system permease protein